MEIRILAEAESEILHAQDWYELKRAGLGFDFELCLEAAFQNILTFPEASPVWYRNTRRILLARFPYGVFNTIKDSTIFVVALFHLKRRPATLKKSVCNRVS